MKILIALDLGDKIPEGAIVIGKYTSDSPNYKEVKKEEIVNLRHRTIISFDSSHMKYDRNDYNFSEAEFYGVLEC